MTAHYMKLIGEQEPAPRKPEFSNQDVVQFMQDLAVSESPREWLKSNGCDELNDDIADLLKSMAVTCIAGHGDLQMPGSDRFWQVMKRFALDRIDFEKDQ